VSFKAVLTPAPEKQWWLRWGVFRCRSCGIISPLFGKTLAINSSPIPPQHKPPSGAKSGLDDSDEVLRFVIGWAKGR